MVFNLSCSTPAGDRIKVIKSLYGESQLGGALIDQVRKYYSYLENMEFEEIYDLLSKRIFMEHKMAMSKSEFIDYFKNKTSLGKCKWEFAYLEMKTLAIRENVAYVEMEYSMKELKAYERKYETYPKDTWWDEWIYEEGEWKLYSLLSGGRRPENWPIE